MKKITTIIAAFLAVSLTAFAETSASLNLSVTFNGFTPAVSIVDSLGDPVTNITFPQLNSDNGTFTAISDVLTIEATHDVTSSVIIYSDDAFSNGFNTDDNIVGLKRTGTSADTAEVPNPDQVVLKADVSNVTINDGDPVGDGSIPGNVSDFEFFVLDKNSSAETILAELPNNGQSTVEFALGIDATNSVPGDYGRSLVVELVVE